MDNRRFMDFMNEDFFKPKEFNVNDFIDSLGDIKHMKAFDILDKISTLKYEDREQALSSDIIRDRLKEGLLLESGFSQWYYREILKRITATQFLSLYNASELREYFYRNDCGHITVFFNALCESKRLNIPVVIVKSQKLRDENMINIGFDSDYER